MTSLQQSKFQNKYFLAKMEESQIELTKEFKFDQYNSQLRTTGFKFVTEYQHIIVTEQLISSKGSLIDDVTVKDTPITYFAYLFR
jgi:hypothetical protein